MDSIACRKKPALLATYGTADDAAVQSAAMGSGRAQSPNRQGSSPEDGPTNFSERPAREGLRQLLTVAAFRTLIRDPAVFLANMRQGPEFLRDRGRKQDLAEVEEYVEPEAEAV